MSGGAKRARDDAVFDEKLEVVPSHTVIVSHFGDLRPDEVVADAVTTCFLNLNKSVTSYVVVPTCGAEALCLANFHDKFFSEHKKGQVKKRYMKKIIPDTAYLKNTQCQVMILFCHGTPRSQKGSQPHYISFREEDSVSVDGHELGRSTPEEAKIWSCSEHTIGEKMYEKTRDGVTLSEVVGQSRLVILLACCNVPIIQEFSAEEGTKPDFVVLAEYITHDTSNNVLTGLLCLSLEKSADQLKQATWHDAVRLNVCQVLLWILNHENAEDFWTFLQTNDVIRKGHVPDSNTHYRIRGHAHSYKATGNDKETVWREMNTLTLKIWHDGVDAVSRGYYVDINKEAGIVDLHKLIDGEVEFADYNNFARTATLPYASVERPTPSGGSLDALMLQLQALAHGV
jgi:hypothetical protein